MILFTVQPLQSVVKKKGELAMEIRNCPQCGKVFAYIRRNLCPDCMQKEEELFQVIRDYICNHPGSTVLSVAENTGIKEEIILRFLREGRLESSSVLLADSQLTCEMCGRSISSGKLCEKCANKLRKGFTGETKEDKKEESQDHKPKVYTLDRIKDNR